MSGIKTVIYPVHDLARAKEQFIKLTGTDPTVDEEYYVHFAVAGQEVGLDPNGPSQGLTGPVPYWQVEDIEVTLRQLLEAGAETKQELRDVGGGRIIASVKDADGNMIGLIQQS
jgi:predicted enzyme related to lactoylglutathione lyase